MKEWIAGGVLFAVAAVCLVLSVRSFCQKGVLLNNAWLYASPQEREKMDKKPHYRQSAVVFLLLGGVFALNGCAAVFRAEWLSYAGTGLVIAAVVYGAVSSALMAKRRK